MSREKANPDKIWNTPLNKPLTSSRLVRRVILDENIKAGWPVKWGGQWDIAIGGKLISTGLTRLTWTGQNWINFISKHKLEKKWQRKQLKQKS